MIPATAAVAHEDADADWRRLWREAVIDGRELLHLLELDHLADRLPPHDAGFALRVPRGFVARMRRGDATDPLLLQVLPQLAETEVHPGFSLDAVGDMSARGARGVLHKYAGRALLIASGACAVNCRYCFRRHFPYGEQMAAAGHWREALDYLRDDAGISELILSGGDPLSLSTAKLAELSAGLARIPHVRRLRIHSRLPVVLPERIDAGFVDWLASLPQRKVVVIHANHANELDAAVMAACTRLREAGVMLFNQSVLLRGINDNVDALANLSERLFECGVVPYYLHQLDRVQGATHFEVTDEQALALMGALRARLPGYLVPQLVREVAGADSKLPVTVIA
ncbi:MAG TPA: EF-P beta-lysylation protein EpmB [Rhodanobacteraceae bacterium]